MSNHYIIMPWKSSLDTSWNLAFKPFHCRKYWIYFLGQSTKITNQKVGVNVVGMDGNRDTFSQRTRWEWIQAVIRSYFSARAELRYNNTVWRLTTPALQVLGLVGRGAHRRTSNLDIIWSVSKTVTRLRCSGCCMPWPTILCAMSYGLDLLHCIQYRIS